MVTEDWRVGVLFSREGVTSAVETTMANATHLAIDEINAQGGVLGRQVSAIDYDPKSSPRVYRDLAFRLMAEDRVPGASKVCPPTAARTASVVVSPAFSTACFHR
jgi:branched-chain amino acid transport system substrate-binding protein